MNGENLMSQSKISASTKKKLEEELEYLISVGREEIAQKIKEARSFGDLSENSEYDEAKNEQAKLEAKISKLEDMINNSIVIADDELSSEEVGLGCIVKLKDLNKNVELQYSIVSSFEANPSEGKISDQSPLGKLMLGKKVGAVVELAAVNRKFEILEISLQ